MFLVVFVYFFRFYLPEEIPVHSSADVNHIRKNLCVTGEKVFQSVAHLCIRLREIFPQADIVFLGTSRCWWFGPKRSAVCRSLERNERLVWRPPMPTEKRKRISLNSCKKIFALPVYRTLRCHFLKVFRRRNVPSVLKKRCCVQKHSLKRLFFDDVFFGLKEKDIWDEFGHLSFHGAMSVSANLTVLFRNIRASCV